MTAKCKRAEACTPTLSSTARQGGTNTNPNQELTMTSHTPTPALGATTAISPTLGTAYRSGAKTVDQLLVELVDQFTLDAMAIDPTVTGAWCYRDLTVRGRDPAGAVQGLFIERDNAPFIQKAGA